MGAVLVVSNVKGNFLKQAKSPRGLSPFHPKQGINSDDFRF